MLALRGTRPPRQRLLSKSCRRRRATGLKGQWLKCEGKAKGKWGKGKSKGGFSLETREKLLAGGDTGESVVVGDSAGSYLVELVSGVDPDNVMPQKASHFSPEPGGLGGGSSDQGLTWEEGANFAKAPVLNMKPNRPKLPGPEGGHPIDRLLKPYFAKHGVDTVKVVSDRIFARRVYLDTIGLLPPVEELSLIHI